jgi:hypothetical protein
MSDKILEQRRHIEISVKAGINASGTLALLALVYGAYAMKKSNVLKGTGGPRKSEKMCRMVQEVGSQKRKGQKQMWTEYEPWCADIED